MRSDILNASRIVRLAEAGRLRLLEMEKDERVIAAKKDRLQSLLCEEVPNLVVNGDTNNRLAGNLYVAIPTISNSAIIAKLIFLLFVQYLSF